MVDTSRVKFNIPESSSGESTQTHETPKTSFRISSRSRLTSRPVLQNRVNEVIEEFTIEKELQEELVDRFLKSYETGLKHPIETRSSENPEATCYMLPSFVTDPPTGHEQGLFLALDLGGTNFRVMAINLESGQVVSQDSRVYKVPVRYRNRVAAADVTKFFTWLADKIYNFLTSNGEVEFVLHQMFGEEHVEDLVPKLECSIGFTFSFACEQTALNVAKVSAMGKGFNIEGISGQCVVELMQNAINRHDGLTDQTIAPNKIIKAICNDAVGTLVSSSYEHQNVKIGLICGTGLNASYEEFTKNIKALPTEVVENHEKMLINTEVGVFGSNEDTEKDEETEREFMIENGIFTNFDREIDEDERFGKPEFLVLEKMCSGKYLGEIVRRILRSLSADVGGTGSVIFKNCEDELNEIDDITGKPSGLREKVNLFDASFLSKIEKLNVSEDIEELQEIILDNCKVPAAQVDVDVVYKVCSLVSLRSATLVACAMVGLAKKIWSNYGEESGFVVTCGVDGSLYTKHPCFANNLRSVTNGLLPDGLVLKYVRSHDASGKGAALMAAGAK